MSILDHIGVFIREVELSITNYVKSHLHPYHLTPEQLTVLLLLWEQEGLLPCEIAVKLNKDRASITRMVHSLEKKGYLRKDNDPNDRRALRLYLTEEGRNLEKIIIPLTRERHGEILKGISEEELNELKRILSIIQDNVKNP